MLHWEACASLVLEFAMRQFIVNQLDYDPLRWLALRWSATTFNGSSPCSPKSIERCR
jgi:hypothetical protein